MATKLDAVYFLRTPESEKQCSSGTVFSAFCTVCTEFSVFLLNSVALTMEALKTELQ